MLILIMITQDGDDDGATMFNFIITLGILFF